MEIVLISDGPLPLDSPVRKLPFFFGARLVDMAKVSQDTVGDGKDCRCRTYSVPKNMPD